MMLSSRSMGLGCVLVVVGSFVMLVSRHLSLLRLLAPLGRQHPSWPNVPIHLLVYACR
jgi:hypothetical protein